MLPTKVIISAFGSYPKKTVIDMEKLGRRGVYLITGETGAGKSTIFDAITFALFDMASGGKDKQLLRSQYASPDTETFVDLYFDHKDTHYRFLRYLPKVKDGRSTGSGKDLSIYTIDENNVETCINLNYKVKENKALVNDILGVDYNQFKQVAMLAQGDFFKLVETKSSDRRAVFSKIFDTSVFAEIENAIRDDNRAAAEKVNRKTEALRASLDALVENETRAEELGAIKAEALQGALTDVCLEKAIGTADQIISEDKLEREQAQTARDALDRQIAEKEALIKEAEKAAAVNADLEKNKELLQELDLRYETAKTALADAEAHEGDIKAFRETAAIEKRTLPKYKVLSQKRKESAETAEKLELAKRSQENETDALERTKAALEEADKTLSGLSGVDAELGRAEAALEKAAARSEAAQELSETFQKIKGRRRELIGAQNDYITAENRAIESRRLYLIKCMAAARGAERGLEKLAEQSKKCEAELAACESRVKELANADGEKAGWESRVKEIREKEQRLSSLAYGALGALRRSDSERLTHYSQLVDKRAQCDSLRERFNALNDAYHLNAVWKIASELEDGEPCPVCGSLHHPKKAEKPAASPDKDELAYARSKYEKAQTELDALDKAQIELDKKCETARAVIMDEAKRIIGGSVTKENAEALINESLEAAANERTSAEKTLLAAENNTREKRLAEQNAAALRSKQTELSQKGSALTKSLAERRTLSQSAFEELQRAVGAAEERCLRAGIDGFKDRLDLHIPSDIHTDENVGDQELTLQKANTVELYSQCESSLSAAAGSLKAYSELRIRFGEQYKMHFSVDVTGRSPRELEPQIAAEAQTSADALKSASNTLDGVKEKAAERDRAAAGKKQLEAVSKACAESIGRLNAEISRLEESLLGSRETINQLESELSYESEAQVTTHIEKLLQDAQTLQKNIDGARAALEDIRTQRSTLGGRIAELEKQLEGFAVQSADFDAHKRELEEMKNSRKIMNDRLTDLNTRLRTNENLLEKLRLDGELRSKAQKNADMVDLLYRTVSGNVRGKEKLDLETFVQLHYFDTVISHANERLRFMTNGQYELTRRGAAGNLRNSFGLDLDIVDHFCADPEKQSRDVTSISGGEKFKAALSLALGLSDEIMRRAGAIRFDTLFVDEGFGSLDGESLNLALRVLDELSTADDRLIGIISHVETLKDSIDKQLVVKKNGGEGSRIEIKV